MKVVTVVVKTEADGFSTNTEGQPKQTYLTLEEAVEAGAAYLHNLHAQEKFIGFVNIEEG